jgi:NADH dehydrogenase/NADH:ubiquinone oxidoreductase subunit G
MERSTKIFILGSATFLSGTYLVYRTIKRSQSYNLLLEKIKNLSVIDNRKVNEVLNGVYHTNIPSSKSFAILNESKKREIAEKIKEAASGVGTDEDSINAAINELRDKIAISQVAAYYQAKNNITLLSELKTNELNNKEFIKLSQIINSKPDIRWLE